MATQSDEKLEPAGVLSELANGEDPGGGIAKLRGKI
jgi:hypothetical protein